MKPVLLVLALAASVWIYAHPEETIAPQTAGPRIVSLVPSLTENLFAVGAGDCVVGVTTWCTYPPQAQNREKVGDVVADLEAILKLRPSIIVSSPSMRASVNGELERLGLRVEKFEERTMDEVADEMEQLAVLAGVGPEAAAMFRHRLDELSVVDPERRPSVYYEVGNDPPYTAGPGSALHDLIVRAGGRNAFEDLGRPWGEVEWEEVVARNPDVVVLHRGAERTVETRPGWTSLTGHVHYVDPDLYLRPTMRMLSGLEELRGWIAEAGW